MAWWWPLWPKLTAINKINNCCVRLSARIILFYHRNSDLVSLKSLSGSYWGCRTATSSGQCHIDNTALLTNFNLLWISFRIYLHSQVHIKENLKYRVVIRCLLQNIFLSLTNPLESLFSLFWISNPLCLSIPGDDFDTVLTPVMAGQRKRFYCLRLTNLEKLTYVLLLKF
jgi:hypothetical protein